LKLQDLWPLKPKKIAFFWQIQDPGNAGNVIRSADAAGFDAVIFSNESVDVFNPKTVRATAGALWHIPVVSDVKINEFIAAAAGNSLILFALAADGAQSFNAAFVAKIPSAPTAWIFGNEARGLPDLPSEITTVAIPMKGYAESLNVASAAAIVLHSVGLSL
jgi:TrmH family RNA methyltransferase